MSKTMGQKIASLRLARGMTQERLARELGVSAQAVSKWENDLNYPDVTLIVPLARLFGVTADELLGDAEPAPEPASAPLAPVYEPAPPQPGKRGKSLHILVDEEGPDGDHVDISIPLGIVKFAAKMGVSATSAMPDKIPASARSIMQDLDLDALLDSLSDAEAGTLVDVHDGRDHVCITIE